MAARAIRLSACRRFLLCHNFYSSLINMPIIYIEEIETSLSTLIGRVPGFMEAKGR
jgi:hypothetical protein